MNDRIRVRDVRLIGEEGEQFGIVPTFEALRIAQERGLDLVEVAPTAVPPVCRLMDYGRFKYEQTKSAKEAKKNQKFVDLKEVRLTPRTDEHDVVAKVKSIHRFLDEGNKVKVTIRFRGRELAHPQLGRRVLDEVSKQLGTTAVVERPPMFEGRAMFMIIAPPGARPAAVPAPQPLSEQVMPSAPPVAAVPPPPRVTVTPGAPGPARASAAPRVATAEPNGSPPRRAPAVTPSTAPRPAERRA